MIAAVVAVTTAIGTAVVVEHLVAGAGSELYLSTTAATGAATGAAATAAPQVSSTTAASPAPAATHRAEPVAATGSVTTAKKAATRAKVVAKKKTATTRRAGAAATRAATSSAAGRIRYGTTYSGVGTFYGATGAGNCSYGATRDLMVAAMNQADYENSQACGAYVKVTSGGRSVTVKIVDRCPECGSGDLDLSRQAFTKLAAASRGRIKISWTLRSPAGLGPVAYTYKSGSSKYWCGIQVRNNRNPVRSLEVRTGSSWKSLTRANYNYFLSASGTGCGSTIRVTDIFGHRLIDSGIKISPDVVQAGTSQFGPAA